MRVNCRSLKWINLGRHSIVWYSFSLERVLVLILFPHLLILSQIFQFRMIMNMLWNHHNNTIITISSWLHTDFFHTLTLNGVTERGKEIFCISLEFIMNVIRDIGMNKKCCAKNAILNLWILWVWIASLCRYSRHPI